MAAEVILGAANVRITHDKSRNLQRFVELIEEAAAQRVDVLVLPEMGLQGYADFAFAPGSKERSEQKQYYQREAESIPGPSTAVIRQAAERFGMFLQIGLSQSSLSGHAIYNIPALISSDGFVWVYPTLPTPFELHSSCPGWTVPVF